jgi:hypothetical protein
MLAVPPGKILSAERQLRAQEVLCRRILFNSRCQRQPIKVFQQQDVMGRWA